LLNFIEDAQAAVAAAEIQAAEDSSGLPTVGHVAQNREFLAVDPRSTSSARLTESAGKDPETRA
jgi:hypothetical protein